jgi:hypothetical protein
MAHFLSQVRCDGASREPQTLNPKLQWLIPCLRCAAMEHRVDARAFSDHDCPYESTVTISHLPPGFFDRLIVGCSKM